MAHYLWYGEDNRRLRLQGIVIASSRVDVQCQLAQQGIALSLLIRLWPWQCRYQLLPLVVTMTLFKQWGRMLQSGLNVSDCVSLAMPAKPTPQLRWQLCQLDKKLQQGQQLSQALQQINLVPPYQAALLDAAEQAGQLGFVMEQFAKQQAAFQQLLKTCRKSLLMPAITLTVGILISIMLLIGLVPNISGLVATGGREIPTATQWLISLSDALHMHGMQGLQGMGVVVLCLMAVMQIPVFNRYIKTALKHHVLHRLPLLGRMLFKQQLVHLLQMLAVSHGSGVTIIKSLDIFGAACDNNVMQKKVEKLRLALLSGSALSTAFATAKFDETLVRILMMGERTGELSLAYQQMAEDANTQLQDNMQQIRQWLEPMVTLFLALLVGGLVMAIYLPLMQLGSLM